MILNSLIFVHSIPRILYQLLWKPIFLYQVPQFERRCSVDY
jgi:hypothetical protein